MNHKHRTKYIAKPEFVKEAGIHDSEYWGNHVNVPNSDAFLAHYRYGECPCKMFIPGGGKKKIKDTSMLRFKSLMKNTSFYHLLERSNKGSGMNIVNITNVVYEMYNHTDSNLIDDGAIRDANANASTGSVGT